MQTIEITGATGTGPYDVYVCDITNTYCFLISGSTTIPPSVYLTLPTTFNSPFPYPPTPIIFGETDSLIIKIVDLSSGCETFVPYYCPSPTPTMTPTPTPTPTPSTCLCNQLSNSTGSVAYFAYVDCNGVAIAGNPVAPSTDVYVCGNSVVITSGVLTHTVLGVCIGGSC